MVNWENLHYQMNRLGYISCIFCVVLLYNACKQSSALTSDFECDVTLNNLESVSDFQNNFSIPIPGNWKVNLYYDNAQSSIYFADTTKQLTETTIVDVTFIKKKTAFDADFLKTITNNYVTYSLTEETNKELTLNDYPSYYSVAKGSRNNFPYAICNVFVNTAGDGKFIHAKIEIYGDSLVNERFCSGISLLEKIRFK